MSSVWKKFFVADEKNPAAIDGIKIFCHRLLFLELGSADFINVTVYVKSRCREVL